jgi:uncharacterized membrane protein
VRADQHGIRLTRRPARFSSWLAMPENGPDRLLEAAREARDDAAPFSLASAGLLVLLAVISQHAHWTLVDHQLWWIWLVVAAPWVCLYGVLLLGLSRLVEHDRRREIVIGLLTVVWIFTVAGVVVLLVSLLSKSGSQITGRQLLLSAAVVLFTNGVAFGLSFWELDCGGPVARALSTEPRKPDFQFPQDENPTLAREEWAPRLWDYLYVSLTNTMAFSPTDTQPMTRAAKRMMGAESLLSGLTILLVAARAVNILK